jgi:hypothetical protein
MNTEQITIRDFMEVIEYRITEGSEYGWDCFGNKAFRMDHWAGEQQDPSLSIVFDTATQVVYQMEAHDYVHARAYRWTNPDWREAEDRESRARAVDNKVAWDDVLYIDLDVTSDMLEKATAIVTGDEYDTRVKISLEFSNDELLEYMMMAHEKDVTFNEFITQALESAIAQHAETRDPE